MKTISIVCQVLAFILTFFGLTAPFFKQATPKATTLVWNMVAVFLWSALAASNYAK